MKETTKSKAAAKAMARRIAEIETLLQATIKQRDDLLAQRPGLEHQEEEALLSPDGGSTALADLDSEVAACEKKIEVIMATISRDRHSPEIEKLARTLWRAAFEARNALSEGQFPGLLAELEEIKAKYLDKVKELGLLAQSIAREERLMNLAARPYLPVQEFMLTFHTGINVPARQGSIFIDDKVAAAYEPGNRQFTAADVLAMLHPEPGDILKILEEEI